VSLKQALHCYGDQHVLKEGRLQLWNACAAPTACTDGALFTAVRMNCAHAAIGVEVSNVHHCARCSAAAGGPPEAAAAIHSCCHVMGPAWPMVLPVKPRSQRSGSELMGGSLNSACAGALDSRVTADKKPAAARATALLAGASSDRTGVAEAIKQQGQGSGSCVRCRG
jgi:hypothetical protein